MRKLITVVLYKCDIFESATIKSLMQCEEMLATEDKICIWDNSPNSQNDKQLIKLKNKFNCEIIYQHTPENISLAKIYNNVIVTNREFSYLFLLDQDSEFDIDFFLQFENIFNNNSQVNLCVPLIENSGHIVSPGNFYTIKGKYWSKKQYGKIVSFNNVAIASGMIINMAVFSVIGLFDEQLKLYGVDTNFMIRFRRKYPFFFVMAVNFVHSLSDHEQESLEVKLRRFKDLRSAAITNSKLFRLHTRVLTRMFYFYKALNYGYKYKSLKFIS